VRHRRHPALPGIDNTTNGGRIEARCAGDDVVRGIGCRIDQRGCPVVCAQSICAVARLAILLIHDLSGRRRRCAASSADVLAGTQQPEDTGIVMRDDIDNAFGRLACRASKEHTAVTRWNMHRVVETDRREQALVGRGKQSFSERVGFVCWKIRTDIFDSERLP
jgi:hypothetical protein